MNNGNLPKKCYGRLYEPSAVMRPLSLMYLL